jgi:Tol biopolymer transport system component
MTNPKKIGIAILIVVCLSVAGYMLWHFLLGHEPPANPRSERIAFTAGSTPWLETAIFLNYDIYVMNVGEPGLTRITWDADGDWMPTWSPQGDKIAYYGANGLYVMNADGSSEPEQLRLGATLNPAWSPDGSRIAFAEDALLYILDVETHNTVQLTDGSILSGSPTWAPDGKRIAFATRPHTRASNSRSEAAIAVINTDGSGFVQLTKVEDGSSGSPRWSPNGMQIAFERNGDIYVMEVNGMNVRALTHDGKNQSPTWSPDGSKIAFVSFKNAKCGITLTDAPAFCTSELYVMNADGSNVRLLRSKRNEKILDPAWSP